MKRLVNCFALCLCITFILLLSSCRGGREVFDVKIEGTVAVFMFVDENECLGCSTFMLDCFSLLNNQKDLQATAIVNCKREKQLKTFNKNYNWNYLSILDKNYKEKYNLNPNTVVVLAFQDSENLIEFCKDDIQAIEKIKSYIRIVQNEIR